jgi:isoamylase
VISEISDLGAQWDLRLIAEAWDIGAYMLGRSYPGLMWRQWNAEFRDDLRSFIKGDPGKVGALMRRLYGSDASTRAAKITAPRSPVATYVVSRFSLLMTSYVPGNAGYSWACN